MDNIIGVQQTGLNLNNTHSILSPTQTNNARQVTIKYISGTQIPKLDQAAKLFSIMIHLPGMNHLQNQESLLHLQISDFKDCMLFGRRHIEKQVIEFATYMGLKLKNQYLQKGVDLGDLWASEEGLQKHHDIWQVTCIIIFVC